MTYNPFGILENSFKFSYKHVFPSGMYDELKMRHKADNSVNFLKSKYFFKKYRYWCNKPKSRCVFQFE